MRTGEGGILLTVLIETYPPPEDGDEDYCPDPRVDTDYEDYEFTLREAIDMLRGGAPSSWPIDFQYAPHVWVTHDLGQEYYTGEYKSRSVHYSQLNHPRNARRWALALRLSEVK